MKHEYLLQKDTRHTCFWSSVRRYIKKRVRKLKTPFLVKKPARKAYKNELYIWGSVKEKPCFKSLPRRCIFSKNHRSSLGRKYVSEIEFVPGFQGHTYKHAWEISTRNIHTSVYHFITFATKGEQGISLTFDLHRRHLHVTWQQAGRPRNRGSSDRSKRSFSSSQRPDQP